VLIADTTDVNARGARRECCCRRARHRHGTRDAYLRDECRCPACRAANAEHQRAFRRGRAVDAWHGTSPWAPAVGTRRRLQALTAAGWSASELAARLGVTKSAVAQLRSVQRQRVLARTALDVATLYDDCWWRTPPGRYQARAERYAETRGWVAPWRWDGVVLDDPAAVPRTDTDMDVDEVAIEECIAGRPVPLTKAERHQLVATMQRRGATSPQIALRLGRSTRTAERYQAAARSRRNGAA